MIRIGIEDNNRAIVVQEPNWLERLFRIEESTRIVTRFPDISTRNGGGYVWLYENGRTVSDEVRRAINDAYTVKEWQRILGKRGQR